MNYNIASNDNSKGIEQQHYLKGGNNSIVIQMENSIQLKKPLDNIQQVNSRISNLPETYHKYQSSEKARTYDPTLSQEWANTIAVSSNNGQVGTTWEKISPKVVNTSKMSDYTNIPDTMTYTQFNQEKQINNGIGIDFDLSSDEEELFTNKLLSSDHKMIRNDKANKYVELDEELDSKYDNNNFLPFKSIVNTSTHDISITIDENIDEGIDVKPSSPSQHQIDLKSSKPSKVLESSELLSIDDNNQDVNILHSQDIPKSRQKSTHISRNNSMQITQPQSRPQLQSQVRSEIPRVPLDDSQNISHMKQA